jgi:probable HAF family extracellular repeat protein
MGVRTWSRWRAVVVGLVIAGLVLTVAPPPAASGGGGPLSVTMTDLPTGVSWTGIDNRGRIFGLTDGTDQRIVAWQRGEFTDIGPYEPPSQPDCPPIGWFCPLPGPAVPAINDRGTVGTSVDGRAALRRGGEVTEVGGDLESSWIVSLNERDQALVAGYAAGRRVIGLWTRGTFTRLADAPLDDPVVWAAQLSDGGHVLVTALDPECRCAHAFLWFRGRRTDLGRLTGQINRRGQIAGSAHDPDTGESYPFVWQDGRVRRLPTLGGDQSGVSDINDRGQVVGLSTLPGDSDFHTVLWEDGEIVDIGAAIPNPDSPIGINERGQVLIRGSGDNWAPRAFLWDDGDLVALPPDQEPWSIVEASGFNDRGQIYGRRTSDAFEPYVPTLWTVRRRVDS